MFSFLYHSGTPANSSAHRCSKAYPILSPRPKMDRFATIGNTSERLTFCKDIHLRCFMTTRYASDVHILHPRLLHMGYNRSSRPEVFCKKLFLKILQNSLENTYARASFLIKNGSLFLVAGIKPATLVIKKETLPQVFSCEFCNICNKSISYRTSLLFVSRIIVNFNRRVCVCRVC